MMATLPRLSVCLYLRGAHGCREISAGGGIKKDLKHKKKVVIFLPGLDTLAAANDVTLSYQRKANCCTALYRR